MKKRSIALLLVLIMTLGLLPVSALAGDTATTPTDPKVALKDEKITLVCVDDATHTKEVPFSDVAGFALTTSWSKNVYKVIVSKPQVCALKWDKHSAVDPKPKTKAMATYTWNGESWVTTDRLEVKVFETPTSAPSEPRVDQLAEGSGKKVKIECLNDNKHNASVDLTETTGLTVDYITYDKTKDQWYLDTWLYAQDYIDAYEDKNDFEVDHEEVEPEEDDPDEVYKVRFYYNGTNWYTDDDMTIKVRCEDEVPTADEVRGALRTYGEDEIDVNDLDSLVTGPYHAGGRYNAIDGLPENWTLSAKTTALAENYDRTGYIVKLDANVFINKYKATYDSSAITHIPADDQKMELEWIIYKDGSEWKAAPIMNEDYNPFPNQVIKVDHVVTPVKPLPAEILAAITDKETGNAKQIAVGCTKPGTTEQTAYYDVTEADITDIQLIPATATEDAYFTFKIKTDRFVDEYNKAEGNKSSHRVVWPEDGLTWKGHFNRDGSLCDVTPDLITIGMVEKRADAIEVTHSPTSIYLFIQPVTSDGEKLVRRDATIKSSEEDRLVNRELNDDTLARVGFKSYNSGNKDYITVGCMTTQLTLPTYDGVVMQINSYLSAVEAELKTNGCTLHKDAENFEKLNKIDWISLKYMHDDCTHYGYPEDGKCEAYHLDGRLTFYRTGFNEGTGDTVENMPADHYTDEIYEYYLTGETIEMPKDKESIPTRAGYTFLGWEPQTIEPPICIDDSTDGGAASTLLQPGDTYTITDKDVLFVAQWTKLFAIDGLRGETHVGWITNANGTEQDKLLDVVTAALTEKTIKSFEAKHPELKGYTADLTKVYHHDTKTPYSADQMVTDDIGFVYIKWEPNTYTVIFDPNGGVGAKIPPQSFTYDEEEKLFENQYVRTGYTFAGWNTMRDGTGTSYANGARVKNLTDVPNGEVTLYAQWKVNRYTITFVLGNGSPDIVLEQDYNSAVTAPANPTRTGYTFAGWDKEIPTVMPAENLTITAQWTINYYTFTFDSQGGSAVKAQSIAYLGTATEPEAPTRAGYKFRGWYTDTTFRTEYDFSTPVTEDTTVYARWTLIILPSYIAKQAPKLNTTEHFAYVQGYPDGTVKPTGNITRAETAAILFRLMDDTSRKTYYSSRSTYRDVDWGSWYSAYVATLDNAGVITDSANGYFRPNEAITRAELAAMLAAFTETTRAANYFHDVPANHWAADAIAVCAKLGWITGYPDGSFRPDRSVTRAELMAMINRATGRAPQSAAAFLPGMKTWSDNTADQWFYLEVQEATNSHSYTHTPAEHWTALTAAPDWSRYE